MTNTIFVQMASYRDPQLIPTLTDLIGRAAQPDALRVVVCWQHAPSEMLDDFYFNGFTLRDVQPSNGYAVYRLSYGDAAVELIDVPHLQTQGVCWARNLIQQHYQHEKYTLQLDAHHRFVEHWDAMLIDMLESLRERSPKPILTAYLPAFDPENDPAGRVMSLSVMTFDRFNSEGFLTFSGRYFDQSEDAEGPVRARFYSAHFAFADGPFAVDVQHDPQYFFWGEEISISARAYTYGYDCYHPHRVIAWHHYSRERRPTIWGDHTTDAKRNGQIALDWGERHELSRRRNRCLFGIDGTTEEGFDLGRYGFGNARSLAEYERFAGLCFALRGVHDAAVHGRPPLMDDLHAVPEANWLSNLRRSNEIVIWVPESSLGAWTSASSARIDALDHEGQVLQHQVLDSSSFRASFGSGWFHYVWSVLTPLDRRPVRYALEVFDSGGSSLARVENAVTL